jgi:hypothetical protein
MRSGTSNRVRGTTWVFAVLALSLFCWLGVLTFKCRPIFNGLEFAMRIDTSLAVTYGPIGLPLFGMLVASVFTLSDLFRALRWFRTVLTILGIAIAIMTFHALTVPMCTMALTHR